MTAMSLIVDVVEAAQAQAKMMEAIQNYKEATAAVKAAADDIASKWEGDAKEAFVENETNAYNFYVGIATVATGAAEAVKKMISEYTDTEAKLKSIVSR